jgi:hypothetical protein
MLTAIAIFIVLELMICPFRFRPSGWPQAAQHCNRNIRAEGRTFRISLEILGTTARSIRPLTRLALH